LLNLGLFVALLTASFLLFFSGPDTYAIRSLRELWNLGHILYFGLLVYLFWRFTKSFRLSRNIIWLISLLLTLIWGGAIEVLQYASARTADLMDLSRDFCGTLLVLSFMPGLMGPVSRGLKAVVRSLVVAFALFHLSPLVIALSDEMIARAQFPVLSSFETSFELDRWEGGANRELVSEVGGRQGRQLRIDLDTQRYSGIGLRYLGADWRKYRHLNLDIFHADPRPLRLTVRVHDSRHQTVQPTFLYSDRFNRQFQLHQGWNKIQIKLRDIEDAPRNRKMNMKEVANVALFSSRLKSAVSIYLDRIYLSNPE